LVRSIEYRQLVTILALFLIVQLAGVLIAFWLASPAPVVQTSSAPSGGAVELIFYFAYIVVTAVLLMLLFRVYRGNALFVIIEALVVVSATFYLFAIVISPFLPQAGGAYAIAVSLIMAVALIAAKNRWPQLRNLTAVLASIGVGVVLGSYFSPEQFGPASFFYAYLLMAFIAVYDYVAVFITRHMIALGREAVNRNLSFMIGTYNVEVVPKSNMKRSEISAMKKSMKEGKVQSPELRKLIKEGSYPVPAFSALGTGDLAMPLMLAVSAYLTYMQYFMSLLIVIGGAFGLVFAMYVSKKYKVALPAIPPLLAFISVALGADAGSFGPGGLLPYLGLVAVSMIMLGLMLFSAGRQGKFGDKARILKDS
jgi:presenilin-like A22 family membrane protease